MRQRICLGLASTAAWAVILFAGTAFAQIHQTPPFTILEGYDLPLSDYRSGMQDPLLREITLNECQQHCAADSRCKAFTYNATRRVCILKNAVPMRKAFAGAVSGIKMAASPGHIQVPRPRGSAAQATTADSAETSAPDYKAQLKGPAAAAVMQYLERTQTNCVTADGGEEKCPLGSHAVGAQLFHGRMPGDLSQYAVAFVYSEPGGGGNAIHLMAIVFKSAPGGAFVPLGRAEDIIGTEPRNLRFERDAITYTGTILGPNDARCCPTGEATFKLLLSGDGVKFVDLREREAAETGSPSTPARSQAGQLPALEQAADASPQATTQHDDDPIMQSFARLTELDHGTSGALAEAQRLETAIHQRGGHPYASTMLGWIAGVYLAHGRYGRTENIYKRELASHEKDLEEALRASRLKGGAVTGKLSHEELMRESRLYGRISAAKAGINVAVQQLANVTRLQGRHAEAARLYQRALADSERDHAERSKIDRIDWTGRRYTEETKIERTDWELLGLTYEALGKYADAEAAYQRMLANGERSLKGQPRELAKLIGLGIALTLDRLGNVYRIQSKYAEAEHAYQRSLAIREKAISENVAGASQLDTAKSILGLAKVKQLQGKYTDAEALYRRALSITESARGADHPEIALILDNLAVLYQATHNVGEALAYSRRATVATLAHAGVEAQTAAAQEWSSLVEQRSAFFQHHLASLSAAAQRDIEPASALGREAIEIAQWAGQSAAAAAVQQMATRFASGGDALAARVRESQDLAASWRDKQKRLVAALSKRDGASRAEVEGLRKEITGIEGRLTAAATRLEKEFPDYAALVRPRPLKTEEIQKLLGDDEGLVFWVTGERESYLFALTRDGFDWKTIALGEKELAQKISLFRRGLDVAALSNSLNGSGKPELFDLAMAHELYAVLLAPADALVKDKSNLLVVPSGPLTALPFHLLVTAKPDRAVPDTFAGYRDAAWLLKRHTVSVLPSVSSLKALRVLARKTQGAKPMVGFGDPIFDSEEINPARKVAAAQTRAYTDYWKGADVDRQNLASALPRLEDTGEELKAVAQRLGAPMRDIHLRTAASETTIKREKLTDYRVVYFATHGLVAGDVKGLGEPSLALTLPKEPSDVDDGLLTASEVALLKLNADWVVLSACNTIAGERPGAEALSGLARAFFYAGARALLVSHWAVDSAAATRLTTTTFDRLQKNAKTGRAEALRQAMLDYLNDTSEPRNAYPAFWGPFALIGENAAR